MSGDKKYGAPGIFIIPIAETVRLSSRLQNSCGILIRLFCRYPALRRGLMPTHRNAGFFLRMALARSSGPGSRLIKRTGHAHDRLIEIAYFAQAEDAAPRCGPLVFDSDRFSHKLDAGCRPDKIGSAAYFERARRGAGRKPTSRRHRAIVLPEPFDKIPTEISSRSIERKRCLCGMRVGARAGYLQEKRRR